MSTEHLLRQTQPKITTWWLLLLTEAGAFLGSWLALWLTLEVVPATAQLEEGNTFSAALLAQSDVLVAAVGVSSLIFAFGVLRVIESNYSTSYDVLLVLAATVVASISILDALWNFLLIYKLDATSIVGLPGLAPALFGLGAVGYLLTVPVLVR